MLRLQLLSSADLGVAPVPVAADAEEVRLLNAVSDAASSAATTVVFKGLIGFASISVAGMVARRMNLGFLSGVLMVSGISFVAAAAIKDEKKQSA